MKKKDIMGENKMKKHLVLFLSLLLTLTLLTSCTIILPSTGGGDTTETPDGGSGEGGDETTGGEGGGGGEENENTPILPEIVLPSLPGVDEGDFGDYTTYYRFEENGERFTLYAHQQNEDGEFRTIPLTGTFTEENGNYTLSYESGEVGYGKYHLGTFTLTDESFVCAEEIDTRGGDGVTKVQITPSLGGTDFGYLDLAYNKDGEGMQAFYRDLLAACLAFQASDADIAPTADYYKICELNFEKHGISAEQAQSVWSVFRAENPIFYWLDNVSYYTPTDFYLTVGAEYSLGAHRGEYDTDIQNMLLAAASYIEGAQSDLERALLLHDFLVLRIDYAYKEGTSEPETASWAHNILGAARVGRGVCETYAKTYQLLCQYAGIPTLFVTGYAGEPHAWNLIYLDGEWVGVDVTWDDMNGSSYLTSHFGLSASALAKDHEQDPVGGTGAAYHFKTPTVSPFGFSLCTLTDNRGNTTLCKNLDTALALMTDASAEYTVKYFNYTENGAYTVAPPDIVYYISTATLPECKSLFIGGAYYKMTDAQTTVYFSAQSFTVSTPLTLEDTTLAPAFAGHRGLTTSDTALYAQGTLTLNIRAVLDTVYVDGRCVLSADVEIAHLLTEELETRGEDCTVLIHLLTLTEDSSDLRLSGANLYLKDLETADDGTLLIYHSAPAALYLFSTESFPICFILGSGKDAHLTAADFLTLNEYSEKNELRIVTLNGSKICDRTDFFTLDADKRVVLKELTVTDTAIVSGNMLLSYTGTSQELVLPTGVTHIGSYAFAENDLPFLTVPEGITHICRGAFYGSALTEISLPTTLVFFDTGSPVPGYAPASPTHTYTYRDTYAAWARVVASSGKFALYSTAGTCGVVCTDGAGLVLSVITPDTEKTTVAVSDALKGITSTGGISGKRLHHIAIDESGNATLTVYDVYSTGAYGRPQHLADITLRALSENRYTFRIGTKDYYITVTENTLTYTDAEGNVTAEYPN